MSDLTISKPSHHGNVKRFGYQLSDELFYFRVGFLTFMRIIAFHQTVFIGLTVL